MTAFLIRTLECWDCVYGFPTRPTQKFPTTAKLKQRKSVVPEPIEVGRVCAIH